MKLQHIISAIIVYLGLVSCSSTYYQIAKVASDNVYKVGNNDKFTHVSPYLTITYDFWSENGCVFFAVRNLTDNDIYIDPKHSFFINNGLAHDYFFHTAGNSTTQVTVSEAAPTRKFNVGFAPKLPGAAASPMPAQVTADAYNPVVYMERELITIPARSSKVFAEYTICNSEYEECGLTRNPQVNETAKVEYTSSTSPRVFENRLTFIVEGEVKSISNRFYVASYENLPKANVLVERGAVDCCGEPVVTRNYVSENLFKSPDSYYVRYDFNTSLRTNRRPRVAVTAMAAEPVKPAHSTIEESSPAPAQVRTQPTIPTFTKEQYLKELEDQYSGNYPSISTANAILESTYSKLEYNDNASQIDPIEVRKAVEKAKFIYKKNNVDYTQKKKVAKIIKSIESVLND